MHHKEIIAKINGLLIDEFEIEESQIIPEANLMETLEIDSLDLVDLVIVVEQNFGFKVKTEDMANIRTLQDFYDYVIRNTKSS